MQVCSLISVLSLCCFLILELSDGFVIFPAGPLKMMTRRQEPTALFEGGGEDPSELVARKIIVVGDVQGGYYRSCVKNEVRVLLTFKMSVWCCCNHLLQQASRFRRLVGTMTPPDDSDEAEIYVEVCFAVRFQQ